MRFLFVVHENHFITIFNLETQEEFKVLGPFVARHVEVDELCSYISVLDPHGVKMQFYFIKWAYTVEKDLAQLQVEIMLKRKMSLGGSRYRSRSRERLETKEESSRRAKSTSGDEMDKEKHTSDPVMSKVCSLF